MSKKLTNIIENLFSNNKLKDPIALKKIRPKMTANFNFYIENPKVKSLPKFKAKIAMKKQGVICKDVIKPIYKYEFIQNSLVGHFLSKNYGTPSLLQKYLWPVIFSGKNVICTHQALLEDPFNVTVPLFLHCLANRDRQPRGLIVTNNFKTTLIMEIKTEMLAKNLGLRGIKFYSGMSKLHEYKQCTFAMTDYVITTMGKLYDFGKSERIDLSKISLAVFYKCETMDGVGFLELKNFVEEYLNPECQIVYLAGRKKNRYNKLFLQSRKNMKEMTFLVNKFKNLPKVKYIFQNAERGEEEILKKMVFKDSVSLRSFIVCQNVERVDILQKKYSSLGLNIFITKTNLERYLSKRKDGSGRDMVTYYEMLDGIEYFEVDRVIFFEFPTEFGELLMAIRAVERFVKKEIHFFVRRKDTHFRKNLIKLALKTNTEIPHFLKKMIKL